MSDYKTYTNEFIEEIEKEIEMTIHWSIENDSFDHAFGTEHYPDYAEIQSITYDIKPYTPTQIQEIERYIELNMDVFQDIIDRELDRCAGGDDEPYEREPDDRDYDYFYNQYER